MQRLFFVLIMLIAGISVASSQSERTVTVKKSPASSYKTYGAKIKREGTILPADQALNAENMNKPVWVEATVTDVCKAMGCWLMFTVNDQPVRVAMKDHSFFVPKNIVGKTILIYGTLSEEIITEAESRHYAEDAGKTEKEIEAITGDKKEYTMVGEAVLVPK